MIVVQLISPAGEEEEEQQKKSPSSEQLLWQTACSCSPNVFGVRRPPAPAADVAAVLRSQEGPDPPGDGGQEEEEEEDTPSHGGSRGGSLSGDGGGCAPRMGEEEKEGARGACTGRVGGTSETKWGNSGIVTGNGAT